MTETVILFAFYFMFCILMRRIEKLEDIERDRQAKSSYSTNQQPDTSRQSEKNNPDDETT